MSASPSATLLPAGTSGVPHTATSCRKMPPRSASSGIKPAGGAPSSSVCTSIYTTLPRLCTEQNVTDGSDSTPEIICVPFCL